MTQTQTASDADLAAARAICQKHHDSNGLAMRFGAVKQQKACGQQSQGCFGSMESTLGHLGQCSHFYIPFHGDGCALSFKGLVDLPTYYEEMKAYPRDWNKFEGTERSMHWVKFLLSDQSPWKSLLPFLAETDAEYCNNAGFIFKDLDKLPRKLIYNFAMAVRFPWELAKPYAHWLLLLQEGLSAPLALYIANNFELSADPKRRAKDLKGPWDVIYPWSFLESSTLEAAGRFVLCQPNPNVDKALSPNVVPLWCTVPYTAKALKLVDELADDNQLSLDTIVKAVNLAVAEQQATWK